MSFNFYLLIPLRQQKSQKVHSVKQILSAKRSPPIEFSIRPYRVRRDTRPWRGPVGDPPGKAHTVGAQEGHVHDPQTHSLPRKGTGIPREGTPGTGVMFSNFNQETLLFFSRRQKGHPTLLSPIAKCFPGVASGPGEASG